LLNTAVKEIFNPYGRNGDNMVGTVSTHKEPLISGKGVLRSFVPWPQLPFFT